MNEHLREAIRQNPNRGYLRYHAPRYETLLSILHRHFTGNEAILDIGRSPFTQIASRSLKARIDTLGFPPDQTTDSGSHFQFDLNRSQNPSDWRRDLPRYDIIVFSEVIEHLTTSPKLVLPFLRSMLADHGIIILQTPNAVVLHKRLLMLAGRNPYHLISENTANPKHFREYTARELTTYCREAGFHVETLKFENYFDYRFTGHRQGHFSKKERYRLVNFLYAILPPSLRPGLCLVLRAVPNPSQKIAKPAEMADAA